MTATNRNVDGRPAKVPRKNHLRVGTTHFQLVPTIEDLASLLFDIPAQSVNPAPTAVTGAGRAPRAGTARSGTPLSFA